jgi:hypothetical protein
MNIHSSARFTPAGRALLVRRFNQLNWTVAEAAEAAGVSTRTALEWLHRFNEEGPAGLLKAVDEDVPDPAAVGAAGGSFSRGSGASGWTPRYSWQMASRRCHFGGAAPRIRPARASASSSLGRHFSDTSRTTRSHSSSSPDA